MRVLGGCVTRSLRMTPAPVKLYLYDLSNGLARQLSQQFIGRQIDGIWLVVFQHIRSFDYMGRVRQAYIYRSFWARDFLWWTGHPCNYPWHVSCMFVQLRVYYFGLISHLVRDSSSSN